VEPVPHLTRLAKVALATTKSKTDAASGVVKLETAAIILWD